MRDSYYCGERRHYHSPVSMVRRAKPVPRLLGVNMLCSSVRGKEREERVFAFWLLG